MRQVEEAEVKLWHISQNVNSGYDTYSDAVVAAESEDAARMVNPGGYHVWSAEQGSWMFNYTHRAPEPDEDSSWSTPDKVSVRLIGEAAPGIEAGIICSSFHAG